MVRLVYTRIGLTDAEHVHKRTFMHIRSVGAVLRNVFGLTDWNQL